MYLSIKRILDFAFALVVSVVLLPLILALVLAVRIDSPGPVLFRQRRVGRGKKLFTIYKFRTMCVDAPHDVPTHRLADPLRYVTRVGRFLRKSSLDELPQLWNILRGDMSVVGPRPALFNQYDLIAARDAFRGRNGLTPNSVRPGLTGWAQINGRDELSIPEKVSLDNEYVANIGFRMDCRCFFGTLSSVAEHRGVAEGENKERL